MGRQHEMDDVPECMWDAEHGLVVLYRRISPSEGSRGPFPVFQLVIELSGGAAAYYAGEFAADRAIWVVKAPQQGQFSLLFHPSGSPRLLYDKAIAAIPFDDRWQPEPDQPVGMRHQLAAWLFRSAGGSSGERRPEPEEVELEHGEIVEEGLERHDWRVGDEDALAVVRLAGDTWDSPRGPAVYPFRHLVDEIDVIFTLGPDNSEPPEDLVVIEGFDILHVPTILVDLTAFGDNADAVQQDFHFIHRPHGGAPEYLRGVDLELEEDDGSLYLCWPCDKACHLDFLGVYYAGGKALRPWGDEANHVSIIGQERLEPSNALIGMFYGDCYQMRAVHKIDLDAFAARSGVDGPAMVGLEMERNAAWAAIAERWPVVDLHGSSDAVAFTLTAYAELLEQLLDVAETDTGAWLAGLMDRNGIQYHRFSEFVRRPDLLYALVTEPRLARLLYDGRLRTDALMDVRFWSPSASLAAALEPDDTALPRWVESEPPAVQRALWLFMLAGGAASWWRDLAIPLDVADGDLGALVRRLRMAMTEPLAGFVAPTAEDLGLDAGVLRWPVTTFREALARAGTVIAATAAFDAELKAVNVALCGDLERLRLDPRVLAAAFAEAFAGGKVAAVEDLKQVVMARCAPLGSVAAALAPRVFGLKTRVVLWGLTCALGGSVVASGQIPAGSSARQPLRPPGASPPSTSDAPPSTTIGALEQPPIAVTASNATESPPDPLDRDTVGDVDARAPDPMRLLHWLLAVLADGAFDYPPRTDDEGGDGVDDLLAEAGALLDDVYDYWGLLDGTDPQPLPRWTTARADARERADAALKRAWTQAQRDLDALGDGAARERDAIGALLERVERVRDHVIAEAVWEEAKRRARTLLDGDGTPDLKALCDRMSHGEPGQWEGFAAELERWGAG